MPEYLLVGSRNPGYGQGSALTYYVSPLGRSFSLGAEAQLQVKVYESYTLKNAFVRIIANTLNNTTMVRSRVNGANGNQVISITTTQTGVFEDVVNSDALSNGDLFCFSVDTTAAGAGTVTWTIFSFLLETATNTTPILSSQGRWGTNNAAGFTRFAPIIGNLDTTDLATSTEAKAEYKFRANSTLSKLRVYFSANGFGGNVVCTIRINNGNGNLTISSSASGAFEDVGNTDVISAGDDVNIQYVLPSEPDDDAWIARVQVTSDSDGMQIAATNHLGDTQPDSTTSYIPLCGESGITNAVEAQMQVKARAIFTLANMYVNANTNTLNGAAVYRLRINGGNGNLTISVAAAQTGQFEDLVNSDDIIATDLLNWSCVTAGSSGDIEMNAVGGEISLEPPAQDISLAGAIGTVEAIGSHVVAGPIIASSIATVEGLGSLEVLSGISPSGIGTVEAIGSLVIAGPIIAQGVASVEGLGSPQLNLTIYLVGVASVQALGGPQVNLWVHPDGVASVEGIGSLIIAGPIIATGVASVEGIGSPQVNFILRPSGVASIEGLGTPVLTMYAFPMPADALGFILEARDSSDELLAIFHNAFEIGLVEEVNRPPMLNFKLPSDDSKLAFVISANELWLRNYKTGALLYKFLLSKRKDIRV